MNGDAYKNCHCHVCLGIAVDLGNTFIICSCQYWSIYARFWCCCLLDDF